MKCVNIGIFNIHLQIFYRQVIYTLSSTPECLETEATAGDSKGIHFSNFTKFIGNFYSRNTVNYKEGMLFRKLILLQLYNLFFNKLQKSKKNVKIIFCGT